MTKEPEICANRDGQKNREYVLVDLSVTGCAGFSKIISKLPKIKLGGQGNG